MTGRVGFIGGSLEVTSNTEKALKNTTRPIKTARECRFTPEAWSPQFLIGLTLRFPSRAIATEIGQAGVERRRVADRSRMQTDRREHDTRPNSGNSGVIRTNTKSYLHNWGHTNPRTADAARSPLGSASARDDFEKSGCKPHVAIRIREVSDGEMTETAEGENEFFSHPEATLESLTPTRESEITIQRCGSCRASHRLMGGVAGHPTHPSHTIVGKWGVSPPPLPHMVWDGWSGRCSA